MANQQMYDYDGMESLVLEVIKDYKAENGADKTPLEDYIHDKINVSCSLSTVHKTIERLIEKGVLIKTGYGRARTLYLAEDGYDFLKEPKEEILQDVVHDIKWACKQLLAGEKVTNGMWRPLGTYIYLCSDGGIDDGGVYIAYDKLTQSWNPCKEDLEERNDWQIYVPKPQWTDEEIEYAKHLKAVGFEWLARSAEGCLQAFNGFIPYKSIGNETYEIVNWSSLDAQYFLPKKISDMFSNIKWEDEKPTALDDIINSKESEKQCN